MPTTSSLIGRHDEIERLLALVSAAERGEGGVLVLRGEPGIGKSALLDHVERAAERFQRIRASGSEFEGELPFAALHQLCVPVLAHLDTLSTPYRDSLWSPSGWPTARRTRSASVSPRSNCWPPRPRNVRCCA